MSNIQDIEQPLVLSPISPSPEEAGRALSIANSSIPDVFVADSSILEKRIMVIDDESLNIKAVEKQLNRLGYANVVATTDSSRAVAMLCEEKPDLVLLDIMMPAVNGLAILRQIRADAQFHCLPVIVFTAIGDPGNRREALEAGATDFLTNPIQCHELAPRVRNMLAIKTYQDELAHRATSLEHEVQRQADELAKARHDAELRYLAGKAEIAADVLHNVGNALNSVNVGVGLVTHTVRESKLDSLKRSTDLLREHDGNLANFLTKDERGRVLPAYLVELTSALLEERDRVSSELELLAKHLEHINAVVATQQKYAALCHVREDVALAELLDDVEDLVHGSFARHGMEVIREYHDTPPVNTDRQKLFQVLVNVLRNAMDSVKEAHRTGMGVVTLRFGPLDAKRTFIEVQDNGVGIANEHLTKLFVHGFTTKKQGHGFGLHSCANIVQELGGVIRAHSAGPGKGATFTIELPYRCHEEPNL